jgi:hypothetical protein
VVVLLLALPTTSWPTRGKDELRDAPPVCAAEPDWFAPIHQYYDCNPRITPAFDFASLYSPVVRRETAPNSQAMHRSR